MPTRIDDIFSRLRSENRRGLMPYVCGGHPTTEATRDVIAGAADAGAALVEVGIPFSDPIADGPVIAAAMHETLERGVTPDSVIDAVAEARPKTDVGLVAMVSYSIVHRVGAAAFMKRVADAGFDGLIVPDLSVAEAPRVADHAAAADLGLSLLVAPTTTDERAERIVKCCTGFVYVLTRVGITGAQAGGPGGAVRQRVERLRAMTDLPLACGFGISTPEDVATVVEHADAAIVGTALVKRMNAATSPANAATAGLDFIRELATGLA